MVVFTVYVYLLRNTSIHSHNIDTHPHTAALGLRKSEKHNYCILPGHFTSSWHSVYFFILFLLNGQQSYNICD